MKAMKNILGLEENPPSSLTNCWEFMVCGREPGGAKAGELGVCPASTAERYNGTNTGMNAGRICWNVSGTLCTGQTRGIFASQYKSCYRCPFFREVLRQGGNMFM